GLLQLHYADQVRALRCMVDAAYREQLESVPGIRCLDHYDGGRSNYAYFPVLVQEDYPLSRDALYIKLKEQGIFTRRYFYPLISEFPMYRGLPSAQPGCLPEAERAASLVLCLSMFPDLTTEAIEKITGLIAHWGRALSRTATVRIENLAL